jgi:hypothetical protein
MGRAVCMSSATLVVPWPVCRVRSRAKVPVKGGPPRRDRGSGAWPGPEARDYGSFASFSDPDGNGRSKKSGPGRPDADGTSLALDNQATEEPPMDTATLAGLLREAAEHHHHNEENAPEHDWAEWYAPYISARDQGRTPEEAINAAGLYMEGVR